MLTVNHHEYAAYIKTLKKYPCDFFILKKYISRWFDNLNVFSPYFMGFK